MGGILMIARKLTLCRNILLGAVAAAVAISLCVGETRAQTVTPAYDVVSIKPAKSGGAAGSGLFGNGIEYTADGLRANATVMSLIQSAYGVDADRISGAQGWITSEKFSIDAQMESSLADEINKLSTVERDSVRQRMLQALLADRFKLTVRKESKELPVYELAIAKSGLKIQEARPGDTYADGIKGGNGKGLGGDLMVGFGTTGNVRAQGIEIGTFVQGLSRYLKRPVVDKTGLTGRYDFTLHYAPDAKPTAPGGGTSDDVASDPAGPSLFTAIQEQLGLKLEAKKDPLATVVIEHVERPSGN
jgi:uncharacterized protein (TIGR03435 family)